MALNLGTLGTAVRAGLRLLRSADRSRQASPARPPRPGATPTPTAAPLGSYPGDFHGPFTLRYAPQPDGEPDPGEVLWTWVPYEEDHTKGKDRPVLIVGRNGSFLLALMLTSRDRVPASSTGGDYIDVGTGGWDRQGRPSEARLDRVLQIRADSIRREGAVLDRERFEAVAAGIRRRHDWS